jgi:hypothetical protein
MSYDQVPVPPDATVYADPPYIGTASYVCGAFDHTRFYDWLRQTPFPVYVSEYTMPADFVCIAETSHMSTLGPNKTITERLFLHRRFAPPASFHPDLF